MNAKNPGTDGFVREIERRAYFIWEHEGRPEGRQHEHWARAEAEILSEQRPPKNVTAKKAVTANNPVDKKVAEKKPNGKAAKGAEPVKASAKAVKKKPAAKPKKSPSPEA